MTTDILLAGLAGAFSLAAVANSIASSRYARQAKVAAERASAAATRVETARARIDAAREATTALSRNPPRPGPMHLRYEQVLPIAEAIQRRESAMRAGSGHCPPFPGCPTCGQQPTELTIFNDHPARFLDDMVVVGFSPCGHRFAVDADDLHRATEAP